MDQLNLEGKKILLATGGSGGHVSPALVMAHALKLQGAKVALSCDKRTQNLIRDEEGFEVFLLPMTNRKPGFKGKLLTAWQVFVSLFVAIRAFYLFKPDLVVGFGGYASFPMVLVAMIVGLPLGLHEQNAVLGQVNRFAARSAVFLALSFANTQRITLKDMHKSIAIGNPVKSSFYTIATQQYVEPLEHQPLKILVMAGSQGSAYFDRAVSEALIKLPDYLKKRLIIIQQVRNEHKGFVKELYEKHGVTATLSSYFSNIPDLVKLAHLVVCRGGSSTVFELLAACRPAVIIPLPTSKDNHQFFNAKEMQQIGMAMLIDQTRTNPIQISKSLISILLYPHLLKRMHENALKSRQVSSTHRFCQLIAGVFEEKKSNS